MKGEAQAGGGGGGREAGCDDEFPHPHLLKTDLVSRSCLKNGGRSPYATFTYSSVTVGGYLERCEKKHIHLAISSPTIGTHKPSNRLRGEDNTNMASDFYEGLVNAIY